MARCVPIILALLFAIGAAQVRAAEAPPYMMVKLNTLNVERLVEFYTNVIGLKKTQHVDLAQAEQVFLNFNGGNFEATLIIQRDKSASASPKHGDAFNNLVLVVQDIEAVVSRLVEAGYNVTQPIVRVASPIPFAKKISVAFTKDPDGFPLELVHWEL